MTEADLRIQPAYHVARLNVERVAYGALTATALFLRLFDLGQRPLSPAEAAQALPAWQAAHGSAYALTGTSPLLFGLQRWLFTPLGGDDGLARFWPALFGGLSVALFYCLRDRLGRDGALAAALLWALSPLAVFTGRLGLGAGLTPALALALLACLNLALGQHTEIAAAPRGRALAWAGAVFGALLAAGMGAYTVLLVALVAALIWRGAAARVWRAGQGGWRTVGIAAVVSLALWATAFFTAPAGLAATADLLGGWLRGLIPAAELYAPWDILRDLFVGEPLLVGFGVGGFIMAARRRDGFGLLAGLAALLALLVALVGGGRQPADLGLIVLALTLLAGPAVAWMLAAVWQWRSELDFWLLISLALALMVTLSISLAGLVSATDPAQRSLFMAVFWGVLLLSAGLWVIYGFWGSWRVVRRCLPVVAFVVASVWALGQLNGLNYDADPLRQTALLAEAPGPGWSDFRAALRDLSALNGGGGSEGRVDLLLPQGDVTPLAPVLRWALRTDPAVRVVTSMPTDPAPLVVAPADLKLALGDRYSGQNFTLLEQWQPAHAGAWTDQARWLLYREAKSAPSQTWDVVLWADRKTSGAAGQSNGAAAPTAPAVPASGNQSQ
jgi:hypothetical protein